MMQAKRMAALTILGTLGLGVAAQAQPAPAPPPAEPGAPPLAQLRDDKALTEALIAITQDPAIRVDDVKTRELAQSLMTEGVRQLRARNFDQALANFLEAYGKFPSPRILLNIASTLRDMGRLAEAANTYQRYLLDPASGADRVAEVKELLIKLDEQLTILTVRVFPRNSEISIDGGPFIPVGSSLVTRVRSGIHLVRIKHGEHSNEHTVNGFEGENKEVAAALKNDVKVEAPDPMTPAPKVAEVHQAWMEADYHYTHGDASNPNARGVKRTATALPIAPLLLTPHNDEQPPDLTIEDATTTSEISSGVLGVVRIDGKGRGFAGGAGIVIARERLEAELMVLRSDVTGGYLGGRFRFLTGLVRPYVAAGMPLFVFDLTTGMTSETHVAIGLRGAAGVELMLNGHLSVKADLGVEHFFNVSNTPYEATVMVHTVGVIGRL
ncbi:MAG: hypothetical protein H0T79_19710 [Deltaproteobacteria bacterium]|nr:hypothetical protein [Deltaproteobacteria bacterium]